MTRTCLVLLAAVVFAAAGGAPYQGPSDLVASKDGKSLLVLCQDVGQIAVVDVASGAVGRRLACPAPPTGLALSPEGKCSTSLAPQAGGAWR